VTKPSNGSIATVVQCGKEKLCYYEEDVPQEPAGPHMLKPKTSEMP
jgi:hypothetical protein